MSAIAIIAIILAVFGVIGSILLLWKVLAPILDLC